MAHSPEKTDRQAKIGSPQTPAESLALAMQGLLEGSASLGLLRSLFDELPLAVFLKAVPEGRFLLWNRKCADLSGMPAERALGKTDQELFLPEVAAAFGLQDKLVIESRQPLDVEERRALNRDAGVRWVQVRKSPLIDRNGRVAYVLGVVEDITRRKKASMDLEEAKASLEKRVAERTSQVEAANRALARDVAARKQAEADLLAQREGLRVLADFEEQVKSLDTDTVASQALRFMAERLGMRRISLMEVDLAAETGVMLASTLDLENIPVGASLSLSLTATGRVVRQRQPLYRSDIMAEVDPPPVDSKLLAAGVRSQYLVPLLAEGVCRWTLNVGSERVDGISQDRRQLILLLGARLAQALERARLYAQAQEAARRYQELYDSLPDGLVAFSLDERIVEFNPAFQKMLGYPSEEIVGLSQQDISPAKWHLPEQEIIKAQVFERGYSDVYRKEFQAKDGRVFPVEARCHALKGRDGEVLGIWGIIRDVTHRVAAERELNILAQFPEQNPNPVLRVTADSTVEYANRPGRKLLEGLGLSTGERLPEFFRKAVLDSFQEQQGVPFEVEIDGRIYEVVAAPIWESDLVYLYGRDVSGRKNLERYQKMAHRVIENSIEGIIVADEIGVVQMVNPAYEEITGYTAAELVGAPLDALRSNNLDGEFYQEVWESLVSKGIWSGEYWNRRKDGEAYPEWLTLNVIRDDQGRTKNIVAVAHDITELKRHQEQVRYQAMHDALTGLPNRVLFNDRLSQAIKSAQRHGWKVGVLFVDLDNFKVVNDSLGHDVGDALLKEAAARLTACRREEDTVARLGGDEFIMVLAQLSETREAVRVARRVLASLSEPFPVAGHSLSVSASVGVTIYPVDGEDATTLIRNADMAMYRAKETGKNNYQLFTQAMNRQAIDRLHLESELRLALERGDLVVYYQPRVDLVDGRVVGAEALLRWNKPGEGLVLPGRFIGIAEESGLILPIGQWVLEQACRQAKAWQDQGLGRIAVSVNLSPKQFEQPDLMGMVEETLRQADLSPTMLELEITESTVMKQVEKAVVVMLELANAGVELSVDDFGTGYSSLYYLKNLPLNSLKVDRSFVRDIDEDPNDAAIVETVLSMAQALGLKVVAEGVETLEQARFLRQRGCDQIQGFLFSKALPADQFGELLRQRTSLDINELLL